MLAAHLDGLRTILCLGAHSDDIEIGCGGTLLKLLAQQGPVNVHWVVLGAAGERVEEATRSAKAFLRDAAEIEIVVKSFRDSFFPYEGERIKEYFHSLARDVAPDVIFTHRRDDAHQDHRVVADLTWCAFRNHLIFEYEIPKYEGDLGQPNVYVPLSEPICRHKVAALLECFATQRNKSWFTADTFWSLMRLRGLESNSPSSLAEGLYCRKLLL